MLLTPRSVPRLHYESTAIDRSNREGARKAEVSNGQKRWHAACGR